MLTGVFVYLRSMVTLWILMFTLCIVLICGACSSRMAMATPAMYFTGISCSGFLRVFLSLLLLSCIHFFVVEVLRYMRFLYECDVYFISEQFVGDVPLCMMCAATIWV